MSNDRPTRLIGQPLQKIKVNGKLPREVILFQEELVSILLRASLKGKNLLLRSKFFPLGVAPIAEKALLYWNVNTKAQKLFPIVKLAEKLGGVSSHLITHRIVYHTYSDTYV